MRGGNKQTTDPVIEHCMTNDAMTDHDANRPVSVRGVCESTRRCGENKAEDERDDTGEMGEF
jgi:hypothetical protein